MLPAQPDPSGARAALHAIMSQPAFAHAHGGSWQTNLRQRFSDWLTDLWARTIGAVVARETVVRDVAWVVAIVAVSVLVVWLLRLARRGSVRAPLAIGAGPERATAGRDLARQAVELIRAGRTRDAARVAYRAAVQHLAEEGALNVDESRTPREYLRLLPSPHRRRSALTALTTTFERLWYGSRSASPDDGDRIVLLLQELECLSRERAS